ncbi:hypothetical protein E2C01_045204 [Portunus trituberculatus]|uniref:Uncharacterized protein n=1 Tax=Portunus trituberculatus TaxID=210409 RepID=A0A5B7FUB7_PORTR|nr:hypothetical protein [Portunus trituberculatus]
MEQQFYQVTSDIQTVYDESKQYTDELQEIVEKRCAHAEEKHQEALVSAVHFKEDCVLSHGAWTW